MENKTVGLDLITVITTQNNHKVANDLRSIGVLAIAKDDISVEIYLIREHEDFAFWFRDNGYKLEHYPDLEPIIGAYINPIED